MVPFKAVLALKGKQLFTYHALYSQLHVSASALIKCGHFAAR